MKDRKAMKQAITEQQIDIRLLWRDIVIYLSSVIRTEYVNRKVQGQER
jgi:hypothetical protein